MPELNKNRKAGVLEYYLINVINIASSCMLFVVSPRRCGCEVRLAPLITNEVRIEKIITVQ